MATSVVARPRPTRSDVRYSRVLLRAGQDPAYKARFVADPRAALRAAGLGVPEGVSLAVRVGTPGLAYVATPRGAGADRVADLIEPALPLGSGRQLCLVQNGDRVRNLVLPPVTSALAGVDRAQRAARLLAARVLTDPSAKARWLADPEGLLRSAGLPVPDGLTVRVLADTPAIAHVDVAPGGAARPTPPGRLAARLERALPLRGGEQVRLVRSGPNVRYAVLPAVPDVPAGVARDRGAYARMLLRAGRDGDYRASLLADPKAAFRAAGLNVPEGVAVRVVKNTPGRAYLDVAAGPASFDALAARLEAVLPLRPGQQVRLVQSTPRVRYAILPLPPLAPRPAADPPTYTAREGDPAPEIVPPPSGAGGELSDEELDRVVGGRGSLHVVAPVASWQNSGKDTSLMFEGPAFGLGGIEVTGVYQGKDVSHVVPESSPDYQAMMDVGAAAAGKDAWQGSTEFLAPLTPSKRDYDNPYYPQYDTTYTPTKSETNWADEARIGWTKTAVHETLDPNHGPAPAAPTPDLGPSPPAGTILPHIGQVYHWAEQNPADLPGQGAKLPSPGVAAGSEMATIVLDRDFVQLQLVEDPHLSANANAGGVDLTEVTNWKNPDAVYNALFAWERAFGAPTAQRLFWAGYNFEVTKKDGYDPNYLSVQAEYDWDSQSSHSETTSAAIGLLDFYYIDSVVRWFHAGGTEDDVRYAYQTDEAQGYSVEHDTDKNPNSQSVPAWFWAGKAWDETEGDPVSERIAWAGEQVTDTRYNHDGGGGDDLLLPGVSDPSTDDEGWFNYDTDLSTRKGGSITPGERTKMAFEDLALPLASLAFDILGCVGVIGDAVGLAIYALEMGAGIAQDFLPSGSAAAVSVPAFKPNQEQTPLGNAIYDYSWAVHAWREAFAPDEVAVSPADRDEIRDGAATATAGTGSGAG